MQSPSYLLCPLQTALGKFLLIFILVLQVLSTIVCIGWSCVVVIVVTAMGYVIIARSRLWYTRYTSWQLSLHVLIVFTHFVTCWYLKTTSESILELGFTLTSRVLWESVTFFLVIFYGCSLLYPCVRCIWPEASCIVFNAANPLSSHFQLIRYQKHLFSAHPLFY